METLSQTRTSLLDQSARDITADINQVQLPCAKDTLPRTAQYEALLPLIGNTAMETLELNGQKLYLKRELDNLSGSHYDRAFLPTLQNLEAAGLIRPSDEVRDISSGSAATSLAALAYAYGYKVRLTVPDDLPEHRLHIMRAFGADVVRSGPGYITHASEVQKEEIKGLVLSKAWKRILPDDRTMRAILLENKDGQRICYLNHSENALTPLSFQAIARELVAQVPKQPKAIALAIGNWTTIAGISPVLRAQWPGTKLIGYQGERSNVYENYGSVNQDSAGTNVQTKFRDLALVDEIVQVANSERDGMHERVNLRRPMVEQIGRTSLMGLVVAEKQARLLGGPAVSIAYDQMIRN